MKTMSKILATILIVVLCVSLFTVQAFADEHDDYTCTTLTSVAKKDATCTEDGMEAYWVCDTCGKVYRAATASAADYVGSFDQLKIPATGHTFDPSAETKATCFSPATTSARFAVRPLRPVPSSTTPSARSTPPLSARTARPTATSSTTTAPTAAAPTSMRPAT